MYDKMMLLSMVRELLEKQRSDWRRQDRVLLLACMAPEESPCELGKAYTGRYEEPGTRELPANVVINILRKVKLNNAAGRWQLCTAAWEQGGRLAGTLRAGGQPDWTGALSHMPESSCRELLLLLSTAEQVGSLWSGELYEALCSLSGYSARDLVRMLEEMGMSTAGQETTADESLRLRERVRQLHKEVRQLREDARKQVEEAAEEERESFFAQLNDEANGQILDLLMVVQRGFEELRSRGKTFPMEIRSAQTLVRCLNRFMDDCGVVPMMEIGERMEIGCEDMERLLYDGAPFRSDRDRKKVEVVSPGWEIPDREIVISYPRVRERGQR